MFDHFRLRRSAVEIDHTGPAMAENIGGNDGKILREDIDIAAEHVARGANRMDQQQGRPVALVQIAGADPIDVDELDLHFSALVDEIQHMVPIRRLAEFAG